MADLHSRGGTGCAGLWFLITVLEAPCRSACIYLLYKQNNKMRESEIKPYFKQKKLAHFKVEYNHFYFWILVRDHECSKGFKLLLRISIYISSFITNDITMANEDIITTCSIKWNVENKSNQGIKCPSMKKDKETEQM